MNKLSGWKTYASSIATVIAVGVLWRQGASVDTLVSVGIMGIAGGFAGLRHALSSETQSSLKPETVVDMLESASKVASEAPKES